MARIRVKAKQDYLERQVQRSNPIDAIAEMIWNAVDGDATKIEVRVTENAMEGVESVLILDNGHGIPHKEALQAFENLGNSWKKYQRTSPNGRRYHGEKGEGRFTAFAIGGHVKWTTRWRDGSQTKKFDIIGRASDLEVFEVGEPETVQEHHTGTQVTISNIASHPKALVAEDAPIHLAEQFAVYLRLYDGIQIKFNNVVVDPTKVQEHVEDYPIDGVTTESNNPIKAELTIIEWKHRVAKELVLCDSVGCALATRKIERVPAKGFNFTAYLKSDLCREHQSILELNDLHKDLSQLIKAAKEVMRGHFRKRTADQARTLVARWKEEEVYPYHGQPADPVEEVERQVFDVVALNVNEYLPDFATADPRSKRFSFQMLRSAIEKSPTDVRRIVQEVLELPKEKREELVELLERTSLTSIINASKVVVNRLDFLSGLEVVLFDYEAKKKTKERKHLQRLLAENTWIFGEEFNLAVDDQSLKEVLRKHLQKLGREPEDELAPVTTLDGTRGIVDLMLSKQIPLPNGDEFDHLVVELKRPTQNINKDVITQLEDYAFAVAADERFKSSKVRWNFWALANKMDEFALRKARQSGRPRGEIYRGEEPSIVIWAKTWNEILDECKGRLRFFKDKLGLMATQEHGLGHLRKVYEKYLPDTLKK